MRNQQLEVFSADGRLVRALAPVDRADATWDLRDAAGRPVPSGIHLLRAAGIRGERISQRITVLR